MLWLIKRNSENGPDISKSGWSMTDWLTLTIHSCMDKNVFIQNQKQIYHHNKITHKVNDCKERNKTTSIW